MNGLKEAFSRENLLKDLNFFALLNLGLVLTAVGIVYFKNPNHFAFGGVTGFSTVFSQLLHCSASTFTTAANYAAYLEYCRLYGQTSDTLITMCGAGLKSDH